MERVEIDGVTAFTAPGRNRATGALVFGVGLKDEVFATMGITHLVEHLVMGALPKSNLDANATVDVDTTAFYATGRPEAVGAFLTGVCERLADLPVDRIAIEQGVLAAEDCAGAHPTVAALWAARYGLAGPGLIVAGGTVDDHLSADQVRAHARTWFTRDNAALSWEGPLPVDLRLPLLPGPRPDRPWPVARPQEGPVWMRGPVPGVGMLLTASGMPDAPTAVAVDVLRERVRDVARHARGLSYHVDVERLDLPGARRDLAVTVDAREGQEEEVARVLWEQFWELGEVGPQASEVQHALDGLAEEVAAAIDEGVEIDLGAAAYAHVNDVRMHTATEALDAWRAVTPAQVAAALRAVRPTAIVYLPGELTLRTDVGGVRQAWWCGMASELPAGRVFRPNLLARVISKDTRIALVVDEHALTHQDADGDVHRLPWAEVTAAVPVDGAKGLQVFGRNLCNVLVHEDLYGRRGLDAVRSRLPEGVLVPQRS